MFAGERPLWPGWQSEPPGCGASPGRSACRPAAWPTPPRSARSGSRCLWLLLPSGLPLPLRCCAGPPCFQSPGWETWSLRITAHAEMTESSGGGAQTRTREGLTSPPSDPGAAGSIRVEPLPGRHRSAVLSIFPSVPDGLRGSPVLLLELLLRPRLLHRSWNLALLLIQAIQGAVLFRLLEKIKEVVDMDELQLLRRRRRSSYLLLAKLVDWITVDFTVGVAGEVTGTGHVCAGIWCQQEGRAQIQYVSILEPKVQMWHRWTLHCAVEGSSLQQQPNDGFGYSRDRASFH